MVFSILFTLITLWYIFRNNYGYIPKQSIYAFVLMLLYILLHYHTIESIQEQHFISRYTYIFILYPMSAYYMILFPKSVLIPTKAFFPKLSDSLAIDATIVVAWVGLMSMFLLLFFLR